MGKSHRHLNDQKLVNVQSILNEAGITCSRLVGYIRINLNRAGKSEEDILAYLNTLMAISAIKEYTQFAFVIWVYP